MMSLDVYASRLQQLPPQSLTRSFTNHQQTHSSQLAPSCPCRHANVRTSCYTVTAATSRIATTEHGWIVQLYPKIWRQRAPHRIHGSFGPHKSTRQTPKRHFDGFNRFCRAHNRHQTRSNRPHRTHCSHLCTQCMRCGLIKPRRYVYRFVRYLHEGA